MDIGKKIANLRKERGFTQKELADFLNISDKAVSRWESGLGNPDTDLLPKIAKLFGVTTDYLLGGEETPIQKKEVVPFKEIESIKKNPIANLILGIVLSAIFFILVMVVLIVVQGLILKFLLILMFFFGFAVGVGNLIIFIMSHNDRISVKADCVKGVATNKPFELKYDEILSAKALSAAINNVAIKTKNQQSETKVWMIKNANEIAKAINDKINYKG